MNKTEIQPASSDPLEPDELRRIDAYWRASNYLSVGQIYLYDNPLLREPLKLDHVKPRTQGGGDTWENLVCACIKCNAKKGGRTPDEARMKLIKKPERPKRNPLIALRLGHEKYASWKTFLDNAYWSVELR